jgi:uncharacterized metal-binding protein
VAIVQLFSGIDWNWHQFAWQRLTLIRNEYRGEAISLFLGLELGASSHYLSDWFISAYQTRRKKMTKTRPSSQRKRKSSLSKKKNR